MWKIIEEYEVMEYLELIIIIFVTVQKSVVHRCDHNECSG